MRVLRSDLPDREYPWSGVQSNHGDGLRYGNAEPGDDAATGKMRALTRQFIQEFTKKNGSVNCTELLGYNLNNQDEYEATGKEKLFRIKCPELVQDAAAIPEKILLKCTEVNIDECTSKTTLLS
jgi:hypothetical protein